MRTTRIEIQGGRPDRFAILTRTRGSDVIDVELLLPDATHTHKVHADSRDDAWSMAERMQEALDGVRGCGGDIREYFDVIARMGDW